MRLFPLLTHSLTATALGMNFMPSSLLAQKEVIDEEQALPDPSPTDDVRASEIPAPEPATPHKSKKEKDEEEAAEAISDAKTKSIPSRKGAWSIGFDFRQLAITPDDRRYKQRSVAPDINIGYVHINESWWMMGRAHLVFGPTSQHYEDSPPVDFEGYGFSGSFGKSLTSAELRKKSGDYGVEIGIEGFEIVGRSFRQEVLGDKSISRSWVIKDRWTAVTPAIFATFLEPSRPQGNRSEWLETRVEGYRLSLGVVIPFDTSYELNWDRDAVTQKNRGQWKGVLGLASLTAWLGI